MKIKYLILFCLIFPSIQAKRAYRSAASIKKPSKLMQFTQKHNNWIIAGLVTAVVGVGTIFGFNKVKGYKKFPTTPPKEPTALPATFPAQSDEGEPPASPTSMESSQPQLEERRAAELQRLLTNLTILERKDLKPSIYLDKGGYQQSDKYFQKLPRSKGQGDYHFRCGLFSIANVLAEFFPDYFLSCECPEDSETNDLLENYQNIKLVRLDGHSQKDHKERSCQMLRVLIPGFNKFVQGNHRIKDKAEGVDGYTETNSLALFLKAIYSKSGFDEELILDLSTAVRIKNPLNQYRKAYIIHRLVGGNTDHWFAVVGDHSAKLQPEREFFDSLYQTTVDYKNLVNEALKTLQQQDPILQWQARVRALQNLEPEEM